MNNPRVYLLHAEELDRYKMAADGTRPERKPYTVTDTGTAIISLVGPMQKYGDIFMEMFGGSSSEQVRHEVAMATADPDVDGIFLRIDSPGGEVDGTEELGDAVRAAAKVKPVHAHIEDMGASAAYWVASQANLITANSTAMVGSIGALTMLADTSKAWEEAGIRIHVVSSGPYKGILANPEVTEDALAYVQERIDDITDQFVGTIRRGRKFSAAEISELRGGKVYGATKALGLGLIDAVASRNAAFGTLEKVTAGRRADRAAATRQKRMRRAQILGRGYQNVRARE